MNKIISWYYNIILYFSSKVLFISFTLYFICFVSCVNSEEKEDESNNISLAKIMFFNQVYMDKLFFAGQSGNWELADFYHHELEENMEEWLEGNLMKDTINISQLGRRILLPTLSELRNAIDDKNIANFNTTYHLVVNSCNSCHTLTYYDFINITIPEEPTFKNQEY